MGNKSQLWWLIHDVFVGVYLSNDIRHATEQRLLTIVIRTIELLPIDTNYLTQLTNYLVVSIY